MGLGSLISFGGTDLSVIELFNDTITDPFYIISDNLGHEYTAIQGESVNPSRRHSDFYIHTDRLREVILQQKRYSASG